MTPMPDITLDVDLRNPGQFFACCGVLELASRLWPGSKTNSWHEPEGWFQGRQFHLATYTQENEPPIGRMLRWLVEATEIAKRVDTDARYDDKVYPIILETQPPLLIDWWLKTQWSTASSDFKFWAAHQHPLQILDELRAGLSRTLSQSNGADYTQLLGMKTPMTTRFGLDPVAAWMPLDLGFAPNEHAHLKQTLTAPAIELFAAIGIQGFRPKPHPMRRRVFQYSAWTTPLPAATARAVACGAIKQVNSEAQNRCFEFEITPRGRFKAFSPARELREYR